jgi:lipoprotein
LNDKSKNRRRIFIKKLIKVVAIIATAMLATAFIACSNPSSSDGSSNTTTTDTDEDKTSTPNTSAFDSKLAEGKYTYDMSGYELGYIFNNDYTAKQINEAQRLLCQIKNGEL